MLTFLRIKINLVIEDVSRDLVSIQENEDLVHTNIVD